MSNKTPNSGELLSQLNKNIDKSHHQKTNKDSQNNKKQQILQNNQIKNHSQNNNKNEDQQISQKHKKQGLQNRQKNQQVQQKKQVKNKQTQQSQPRKTSQPSIQHYSTNRSNIKRATQSLLTKKPPPFSPNFLTPSQIKQSPLQQQQDLHQILALQIGHLISQPLAEVIESVMKQRQNAIYIAYTKNQKAYLEKLLDLEKKKDNNNLTAIESLLNKRQMKTFEKLQNGELFIDRQRSISTKNQVQQLHQLDIARLLKIKQGAIRSKLDLLHDKMFQFDSLGNQTKSQQRLMKIQEEKFQEIIDPNNFSLNSQKTKIANDYVKHMKQQKLLLLKKMRQRQQKRQKMQLQRSQQFKQAQQMRNLAKKQQFSQKIQQQRKKKQKQKEQQLEKSKKAEQFLKNYRQSLPLYRKKQNQFHHRYEKSRQKQIQQKLKQIKQKNRSLSLNEIKGHEEKYLQKRQKQQLKRDQQFKMMINAKKASENQKKYFKGFFHDKVKLLDQQQKLKFYSLRQSTKIKIERMTEFDKNIRKNHKPKVDLEKKQALQRSIQIDILKKKKVKKVYKQVQKENGQVKLEAYYEQIPQKDLYKQGNKYMQISKSLAKKSKADNSENNTQPQKIAILQPLEQSRAEKVKTQDTLSPSRIVSQQKDIWRLRSKQLSQMTDEVNPSSFLQIKKNLELMDQKAKKRQQLLKYKQSNAHQSIHEKGMLDQFYLQSIKNKIKLLNE